MRTKFTRSGDEDLFWFKAADPNHRLTLLSKSQVKTPLYFVEGA